MSTVFALNESNHLVHVSEVTRGLACKCRCVQCQEPVLARRGPVRDHHFAHASHREPCESNHESLLHWYAKQLIIEARAVLVPSTPAVEKYMGLTATPGGFHVLHAQGTVQEEVSLGAVRPDILVTTDDGVQVAIEVAYSSFCDLMKAAAFEAKGLPAIEIDLSSFSPDHFDPNALRRAVIEGLTIKRWVWPTEPGEPGEPPEQDPLPAPPQTAPDKTYLPEELVSFSGRWVSIRLFPSGDIAIKVVAWDPDLVSLVRTIAKNHSSRFNPAYKTWNVPRWAANTVRAKLRDMAANYQISMTA